MTAQTIVARRCGEAFAQRYTLVKLETANLYDCGRPGWGVKFQSDPSRRLISDEIVWFESSAQERDDFIQSLTAKA